MPNRNNPFRGRWNLDLGDPVDVPGPVRGRGLHQWMDEVFLREQKKAPIEGKRGEELFHLILSGIREIYNVDATIAGGAVRDLAAGCSTPKDVDVFIPLKWDEFQFSMGELGWQGPPVLARVNQYKKDPNKEGLVVPSTARASAQVQGMTVDLIFMEEPLNVETVNEFPIYAQRCVWTLSDGLKMSPEAAKDIKDHTFTIDPKFTDKRRIRSYVDKAEAWTNREHYKGWKVVEPDIPEWWEAKKKEEEKKANYEACLRNWWTMVTETAATNILVEDNTA